MKYIVIGFINLYPYRYSEFMNHISSFLIGAPSSGSGKTIITLGILKALAKRGLSVQPFKCGPDYIDTHYHDLASGNQSVNLDLYMSSEKHINYLYSKYACNSNVSIIEGVMGLFDGYDRMSGSSAQIASLLEIPVIMVINAKSTAYSAAPILYGFKNFDKSVNIAGVIFNFVGSESHYNYLKDACKDVGLEAIGYLPKQSSLEVPSRHLGLSLDKKFLFEKFSDEIAGLIEQYIDIDRLLEITSSKNPEPIIEVKRSKTNNLRIAVARDEAFNFVYRENIEYLNTLGEVVYFSPLKDQVLPDADIVYLPGGYPELFLKELSDNESMRKSIFNYAENNGRLLAECGGMMYLSNSIENEEGKNYPMVGVLNQTASMQKMKLKLGYRTFEYNGQQIKGHEFHYSSVKDTASLTSATTIYNAKGAKVDTQFWRYKNTIAGYTHIYWAELDFLKLFE